MRHLVEWDALELRIDGARLDEIARAQIGTPPPIERIAFRFENGRLLVQGSIRKFVSIPFTVEIREIVAEGTTILVPIARVSAAGLPVPTLLLDLLRSRIPRDKVDYREPATFVVSLDRFLPPFVMADVQRVWILDGGLAVSLGRGGADLPTGAWNGREPDPPVRRSDG